MILVGCDFHSRFQQIACVDTETGDLVEKRLEHENGEARAFYRSLPAPGRVGVESTAYLQSFARMLSQLGHELVVGDAAKIRAMVVPRKKTDSRDASHLLELLMNNNFPEICVPSAKDSDLRQLLWHHQKLVWIRASVKNQLHSLPMSQGVCRRSKLWNAEGRKQLESQTLDHWAGLRRNQLLGMLDELDQSIERLNAAVEEAGQRREDVRCLMTHPGVGRIVALAFALTVGPVDRFPVVNSWSVTRDLTTRSSDPRDAAGFHPLSRPARQLIAGFDNGVCRRTAVISWSSGNSRTNTLSPWSPLSNLMPRAVATASAGSLQRLTLPAARVAA